MTRGSGAICLLIIVGAAGSAFGQTTGERVIADVTACRAITDDGRRLACFDRAVGTLASARDAKDIVVMDKKEIREKKRSLFGLSLPAINLFGRDDDGSTETDVAQLESKVVNAVKFGRDRWTVQLADGSTWRTTEPARFDPQRGDPVVIKRAALGSFRGSFAGANAVRMERLR